MEEAIIKQLSKYNKKELYQWLIVSMIHPSNQKFGIRYELLIHTLLAIEEDDFLNKPLKRKNIEFLISWFQKKYSNQFMMMEDFESFNQTKLIPLILNGKKYYFFYGQAERPYESIKQFYEILFTSEIDELSDIKKEFLFSLEQQTKMLKILTEDKESEISSKVMYLPSMKFFKKYSSLFSIKKINKNYIHNSTSSYQMDINNFNGLYTKIDDKYYITPFETHIETLYSIAEKIIYSNDFYSIDAINENMLLRLTKIIFQFFGYRQILLGLIDIFKDNTAGFFDVIARVDANKVILFKFIPHSDKLMTDIQEISQKAFKEVDNIKQTNKWIGLRHLDEDIEKVNIVPTHILEFTTIVIFEQMRLNYMLSFETDWKEKDIYIYNSLNIIPILELLSKKKSDRQISLLEYLNAEKRLLSAKVVKADELDSFAYYYNNNESFVIAGKQPDMMTFVPHEWSRFYNKYLYDKYQDNIYELVEAKYPNKFNYIGHKIGSTYEILDTTILDGGRCIKYNNSLIFIAYPNALSFTKEELRVCTFLGEFISFYLDKYKDKLFKLLLKNGFDIKRQELIITLYPDSYIKRFIELENLIPYTEELSENKDIYFKSQINGLVSKEVNTLMIFKGTMELLENSFEFKTNFNPEKGIFQEFILSVLSILNVKNRKDIAQDFINKNWNLKERAFTLQETYSNNPKIDYYKAPHKFQPSFIATVNQEIVTFLKEIEIEPKEYWGDEAKQLNNLIFEFLQKRLEEEISKFNVHILDYSYTQIEYIEGQRKQNDTQMDLDAKKHIAFDIYKQYNKDRMEISELTVSAKHILHTILKVNPEGYKATVENDWYYLMAFSKIITETIQISDELHYKLSETGIKITDSYELIDIDKSSELNMEGYYKKITSSKIISSKNTPYEKKQIEKKHNPKKVPIFDENLNISWKKEFGFYIDDMVSVMTNLAMLHIKDKHNSVLTQLSIDEICNRIQETLVEPPSNEEISEIIKFITLDFNTYNDYNYIDYSIDRLMKKKERLNLSPLIRMKNNKYLFGHQLLLLSTKAWYYPLKDGDIPFYIDDTNLVKKELKKIHRTLDLKLEEKAYQVVKNTLSEIYVEKNILNFRRLSITFQKQPSCGEIDLLIANPKTKILFVMDAKNINKKFSVSAISRELRNFFEDRSRKKSYLSKLNMKVEFINNNQDEILNHFKITDKNGWKIKKGFVVNTLYVSAFYKEKVDFVLIDDLEEYIQGKQK